MYNKKALKVDLGKYKKPNAFKQDIIVDPMGQWKFPGVPTRIPSNDITMQGVSYPVLGVDNTGFAQMMYPGANYTFPGNYVDEYPQMQRGGDISIPKLNQYEDGGEYDLTQEEIDDLIAQGYEIEELPEAQEGGPADTIVYPPGDSEYLNQPPLNFDIIEKEDYEFRKGYDDYLDFLRDQPKKKTPEYYMDEPLRLAEKGGFHDDLGRHRKLLRDWTYGQSIGMLQKAQLGLIKSPYQLPDVTKYPMQVVKQQTPKNFRRHYNALEDTKPQVSESTKPKQTFKPNVNLKDAAQIKKDELNAAAFLVSQDPLLSEKQKADIMMDTKKLEDNIYRIYTENPSSIKQVSPQSKSSRVWEYITNPLTAAEYAISGGGAENMPRNINAMRIAGIDPGVTQGRNLVGNTLNEFYNLADAADKVVRYTGQGDYTNAGLEALRFLPGARLTTGLGKKVAKAVGKTLNTESGLLSNTYKINPKALKEAQEQMLVRARPVGQDPYINMAEQLKAKQAAGEQLTWYQKNLLNPQTNPQMAAREKYFGQWFADNPSDLDFYINPGTRNFADDAQIEILKARMPKSEAAKYNVKNFEDAKTLSNLHDTEYILPKDMVQQAERYSVDDLSKLKEEYNQINKPHWLKGYPEIPKESPGSPNTFTRSGLGGMDMSRYEIKNPDYFTQLLNTYDSKALSSTNKKFYKDLIKSVKKQEGLVTERQYNELQRLKTGNFDFGSKGYNKGYQEGGMTEDSLDYEDLDLTPEEIDWYLANGYDIELLDND